MVGNIEGMIPEKEEQAQPKQTWWQRQKAPLERLKAERKAGRPWEPQKKVRTGVSYKTVTTRTTDESGEVHVTKKRVPRYTYGRTYLQRTKTQGRRIAYEGGRMSSHLKKGIKRNIGTINVTRALWGWRR